MSKVKDWRDDETTEGLMPRASGSLSPMDVKTRIEDNPEEALRRGDYKITAEEASNIIKSSWKDSPLDIDTSDIKNSFLPDALAEQVWVKEKTQKLVRRLPKKHILVDESEGWSEERAEKAKEWMEERVFVHEKHPIEGVTTVMDTSNIPDDICDVESYQDEDEDEDEVVWGGV